LDSGRQPVREAVGEALLLVVGWVEGEAVVEVEVHREGEVEREGKAEGWELPGWGWRKRMRRRRESRAGFVSLVFLSPPLASFFLLPLYLGSLWGIKSIK
jgi:hypothetical protein